MKQSLKILFKFPSRGRPSRFFESLDSIYNNLHDRENFHVSCTLDYDDMLMRRPNVIDRIMDYPNISIAWGTSESKVHAINRDMPKYDWDILCVMSDDMRFTFQGFDLIIRQEFIDTLDLFAHFPDNDAKDTLSTMYMAGRKFYERFDYIYCPAFQSLFCDNEIQEIAQEWGLYRFVNFPGLFFHALPAYGHLPKDEMFERQQEIGWTIDQKIYYERKAERTGQPLNVLMANYFNAYKEKT